MKTAVLFVLMLLVLIIPHEWGHMTVARWCGVKINEFSVGMGPLIFKKKKGDTQYSLRLLPLGGYCAMEGEEESIDSPTSYSSKTNLQKIAILLAGVTMNVIIAIVAVTIALCVSGVVCNTLGSVQDGSPAYTAGLRAGDTIVAINGVKTNSWDKVVEGISSYDGGDPIEVTYERDGEKTTTYVTPEYSDEYGSYMVGIVAGTTKNFWTCVKLGPETTWELNKNLIEGFKMLLTGGVKRDEIAGPVGLVKIVGTASDYGLGSYLMLLAIVSLNLAIFNLIPIPGLDGGKVFFILLKIISGGRINDDMEYKATVIGMAVLLTLFALITINDVMNLFG
ncbi:MAG: RIP metalloprotease RseP [Mogibacterium sp.]|nr:RIP metalloprotease RseP [Mogibacterium sp.]